MHLFAAWLFICSFRMLAYLSNIRLFKALISDRYFFNLDEILREEKVTFIQYLKYDIFVNDSWLWAIFLAFVLSLAVSFIRQWSWINSVLVYILAYISYVFPFRHIRLARWHWVTLYNPVPNSVGGYLGMGILCMCMGLLIFFLSPINRFIDKSISPRMISKFLQREEVKR
jgi:hypothetical protein